MSDTIHLTIDGPRATITLHNPAVHNRLSPDDIVAFVGHLDTVERASDLRVLVITGAGEKTFCSGFDLGALAKRGTQAAESEARRPGFEQLCDRVEACRLPVIGALNGSVYGGGTDLALACDFRLGIKGMRSFLPAGRLGLHYYPGGLRRFVERLGPGNAKRFLMLAEEFPDTELLRMGYVDWLVERSEFTARVDALVASVSALAPLSVQGMKGSINDISREVAFDEARVRARIKACAESADLKEGVAAIAAKRKPVFHGR